MIKLTSLVALVSVSFVVGACSKKTSAVKNAESSNPPAIVEESTSLEKLDANNYIFGVKAATGESCWYIAPVQRAGGIFGQGTLDLESSQILTDKGSIPAALVETELNSKLSERIKNPNDPSQCSCRPLLT